MYSKIIVSLLLVASFVSASENVLHQDNLNASVPPVSSPVVPASSPIVGSSSVVQPVGPVVDGFVSSPVHNVVEHQSGSVIHHQPSPVVGGASYYAPVGVVGSDKPGVVRSYENYGQPEPASLPANYKPFGSWGLYIGGNPADGFYTNYYKNADGKPQSSVAPVVPSSVVGPGESVKPVSALSPILRQASSSPYSGGEYYPFYSPSELNTVPKPEGYAAIPPGPMAPQAGPMSPVQAGASVYGSPSAFESNFPSLAYADLYSTKRLGGQSQFAQKGEPLKDFHVQAPVSVGKGLHHVYQAPAVGVPHYSQPPHYAAGSLAPASQVVAYPIPVGSQIVGSQPGTEGAFSPAGVHAFTRYAVKPTVVKASDSGSNYYSYGTAGVQGYPQPVYKQQVASAGASYYPLSFYGYPMNQLHYSSAVDSVVPQMFPHESSQPSHGPVSVVESDKLESQDKATVVKPLRKA